LPRNKCIFVVDDDPSVRISMKRLLREHGYEVKLFASAVALLSHGKFDQALCLVLDVNLDDHSGIALRQQLAAEGVTVPVIFITGNDSETNRSAAVGAGCVDYLIKPFAAQSFIGSIERLCGGVV
jgi:FixJ family two-component response regulator